jgi:hypothetical protein
VPVLVSWLRDAFFFNILSLFVFFWSAATTANDKSSMDEEASRKRRTSWFVSLRL